MYTNINPATKKAFIAAVAERAGSDNPVRLVKYGPWDNPNLSDRVVIEGPQYPEPHKWYACVRCENGIVKEVLPLGRGGP